MYRGQPIDLLLTDVVMPEMLGSEVAERTHAIRPALPVLYMSGYARPVLDTHGAFAIQIDLLEKPAARRPVSAGGARAPLGSASDAGYPTASRACQDALHEAHVTSAR